MLPCVNSEYSGQNSHKRKLIRIFVFHAHMTYQHTTNVVTRPLHDYMNSCFVTVGFCCAGFVSSVGFLFILIRWVPSVYMQSFVFIFVHNRFDIYEKRKPENLNCVFVFSQFVLRSFNIISLITNRHEAEVEMS